MIQMIAINNMIDLASDVSATNGRLNLLLSLVIHYHSELAHLLITLSLECNNTNTMLMALQVLKFVIIHFRSHS